MCAWILFPLNKKATMCHTKGHFGTFARSCVLIGSSSHAACPMWADTKIPGALKCANAYTRPNEMLGLCQLHKQLLFKMCYQHLTHSAAPASKSWGLCRWPEILLPCPWSPVWQRAVKFSIIPQVSFHYELSIHKWALQYRMNVQYSMGFLSYCVQILWSTLYF